MNLSKEKKKNWKRADIIVMIVVVMIVCVSSILLYKAYEIYTSNTNGLDCRIEEARVLDAYLEDSAPVNPMIKSCYGCLHLDVINKTGKVKNLFFADDYSTKGFKEGQNLEILWCKHPKVEDYIIFGLNVVNISKE